MIRRATPSDAALVRSIRIAALAESPVAFTTTLTEAESLPDEAWADRLHPDAHPTFVWEDVHGAHAMVVALRRTDRPVVDLVAMWVRPQARRRGVGAALVRHVLGWARAAAAEAVRLQVVAGNDGAEQLYVGCGFTRSGRTDVRERDGALLVEMECRFG